MKPQLAVAALLTAATLTPASAATAQTAQPAAEAGWSVRVKGGAKYNDRTMDPKSANIIARVEYSCPSGEMDGTTMIMVTFEQKKRNGKTVTAHTPVGYPAHDCDSRLHTQYVTVQLRYGPSDTWDRGVYVFKVNAKIGKLSMRYGDAPKATYRQDHYCMAGSAEQCPAG